MNYFSFLSFSERPLRLKQINCGVGRINALTGLFEKCAMKESNYSRFLERFNARCFVTVEIEKLQRDKNRNLYYLATYIGSSKMFRLKVKPIRQTAIDLPLTLLPLGNYLGLTHSSTPFHL